MDPYPKRCADILTYLSPSYACKARAEWCKFGKLAGLFHLSHLSSFPSNVLRSSSCHVQAGIRVLPRCRVKSAYKVPHYQTNIHSGNVDKARIAGYMVDVVYKLIVKEGEVRSWRTGGPVLSSNTCQYQTEHSHSLVTRFFHDLYMSAYH